MGFATELLPVSELICVILPSGHEFDRGKSDPGRPRPPRSAQTDGCDAQPPGVAHCSARGRTEGLVTAVAQAES